LSILRDWAELVRVPNTFTTVADILAGYAIATNGFQWSLPLALSILASICLYWSGMVLNDVNDVRKDQQTNRRRPVADGRISVASARLAGYVLIAVGIFSAWSTNLVNTQDKAAGIGGVDSALVAVLLGVFVLLYDSPLKATPIGPVLMGICRGLNMLLGLAAGADLFEVDFANQLFWLIAPLAHTVYVAGFTTAARREAQMSLRWQLVLGWVVAALGIGLWSIISISAISHRTMHLDPYTWYPGLIALLAFPLLRRAINSIASLKPLDVQMAIKQSIMTLIFLDAAAALQFAGTTAGITVCILVVPMAILGLRFRST
jgi:UbiA prenyltransferase family